MIYSYGGRVCRDRYTGKGHLGTISATADKRRPRQRAKQGEVFQLPIPSGGHDKRRNNSRRREWRGGWGGGGPLFQEGGTSRARDLVRYSSRRSAPGARRNSFRSPEPDANENISKLHINIDVATEMEKPTIISEH